MRVLIVTRASAAERPGGDVVVAQRAAEALRALNVDADLVASDAPDARGYDVAHVFGIFEPARARAQLAAVRAAGIPAVVSPIWWDRSGFFAVTPYAERILAGRHLSRIERGLARLRDVENGIARRPGRGAERRLREQADVLRTCDVAVTASEIEAFACATRLGAQHVRYVVAPYAVDEHGGGDANEPAPVRSGVLCVGRIESLKNQAMLLLALHDVDVEVTIVGHAYDARYAALCRRRAGRRTRFVERVSRAELNAMMRRAAVHALPSWGDLPGLVSLEAAAFGARVVAGGRGSEREYLGPYAEYVDPLDPGAIRAAVLRALDAPPRAPGDELARRVGALTWRAHAGRLHEAYALALQRPAR